MTDKDDGCFDFAPTDPNDIDFTKTWSLSIWCNGHTISANGDKRPLTDEERDKWQKAISMVSQARAEAGISFEEKFEKLYGAQMSPVRVVRMKGDGNASNPSVPEE